MAGDALPAIYRNCVDAYEMMKAEANPREVKGEGRMLVWEGFFTKLISDRLNLSTPYFTQVRTNLTRMGCIQQLQRGGGASPSQWQLITPPTPELFREKAPKRSQRDQQLEELRGMVFDLDRKYNELERLFHQAIALFNSAQDNNKAAEDHTPEEEGNGDPRGSEALSQV